MNILDEDYCNKVEFLRGGHNSEHAETCNMCNGLIRRTNVLMFNFILDDINL